MEIQLSKLGSTRISKYIGTWRNWPLRHAMKNELSEMYCPNKSFIGQWFSILPLVHKDT